MVGQTDRWTDGFSALYCRSIVYALAKRNFINYYKNNCSSKYRLYYEVQHAHPPSDLWMILQQLVYKTETFELLQPEQLLAAHGRRYQSNLTATHFTLDKNYHTKYFV